MEKNTHIIDELGNEIGLTYPKRAKGLVKNGRAEYVDDCTIRLLHAQSPMVKNNQTEDPNMRHTITFNARNYKLDKTTEGFSGSRMFVTDIFGESTEAFEIGNGTAAGTRIYSEVTLEADTEYGFRFSMTRGKNDTESGTSLFILVPLEGDEMTEDDWDNRYVYNLAHSQYKPLLCKRYNNSMLKIYEIPFTPEKAGKVRVFFVESGSVSRIYPAREAEAYASFTDFSYAAWLNEKKDQLGNKVKDLNVDQTMREVGASVKNAAIKVAQTVKNATASYNTSKDDTPVAESTEITPEEETEAPVAPETECCCEQTTEEAASTDEAL